jgi:hypothetical protein
MDKSCELGSDFESQVDVQLFFFSSLSPSRAESNIHTSYGWKRKTYVMHAMYNIQKAGSYNVMWRLHDCLLPPVLAHAENLYHSDKDVNEVQL